MSLGQSLAIRLYRTYEELKHKSNSLPQSDHLEFVSYLWGIETLVVIDEAGNYFGLYRTYEELKLYLLVSLWNEYEISLYRTYEELKLLRVMLMTGSLASLYRTYEELKLDAPNSVLCLHTVCIVPMRNWNYFDKFTFHNKLISLYRTYEELKPGSIQSPWTNTRICLYRTYEELKHWAKNTDKNGKNGFVSYLWGIETRYIRLSLCQELMVCIVPMRNWNLVFVDYKKMVMLVCIVPMRNWNYKKKRSKKIDFFSLYRTYEELKLQGKVLVADPQYYSLYRTYEELKLFQIISPLYNLIICLYRTYEELKRKWRSDPHNKFNCGLYRTYEELKPISYREECFPVGCSLYRTYEELKPTICNSVFFSIASSLYRTYEELKLLLSIMWRILALSLYRTYEELKPDCWEASNQADIVCIVPMRNWNNELLNSFIFHVLNVCIVPMRNWNKISSPSVCSSMSFVSYLWGIETIMAIA